ncbi:MAG: NAD(P)/FAD-dependent oxidoreductase [Chloroflexi bacterium]|nr:NAD(P)/FAD-dependent oxidoreductase [Chloroflexota bacterium]
MASRRVLILGGGFGGLYTLQRLINSSGSKDKLEITLVNDENFFFFSPLLHEVATGSIETRHVTYPIRRLGSKDRFIFVQGEVKSIELSERKVITADRELTFDYLILALGSVTDMSGLPSREKNVFTLKTIYDAILIRNHIIKVFEQANLEPDEEKRKQLLTFVVSGGGYTGVQLVAEIRDFIFHTLVKYYDAIPSDTIRIILLETEQQIINGLHQNFIKYIVKHLQSIGVELRVNSRVTRVWQDKVEINGTEILPTETLIWVSGVMANPVVTGIKAQKDNLGRVIVNDYLELAQFPGVFALGDCAHYSDRNLGKPIPQRAHNAVRQAKIVAANVLAEARGREKKRYHYTNSAEIVSLGRYKAILRLYQLRVYGLPARLVWLLAYSSLTMGLNNRVRITIDWLMARLFGRDITLIKVDKL